PLEKERERELMALAPQIFRETGDGEELPRLAMKMKRRAPGGRAPRTSCRRQVHLHRADHLGEVADERLPDVEVAGHLEDPRIQVVHAEALQKEAADG